VLEIHAKIRPDVFVSGSTKYSEEELREIFADDEKPVFVAVDDADEVLGYAFCMIHKLPEKPYIHPITMLYIDDLCVDENARGQHIGQQLYEHVVSYARELGCHSVMLNVWEGNDSAKAFYRNVGMKVKETHMEVIL
jgi:ribosomal protein S18 acetylase RimI-like enzyme